MRISGSQVAAARELLRITQTELATAAGVSDMTILNFELGKTEPFRSTVEKIQAELERRGIEFTNGTGIGVRLNYEKAAEFAQTQPPARNQPNR